LDKTSAQGHQATFENYICNDWYCVVQCFSTFFPTRNPFGKRKCSRNPFTEKTS
jgi:hypothetical protein